MTANDIQIGGEHYKQEYQHWDFVIDTNMHYILACATKYIYRWRSKNGVEDLKKAIHYIQKAAERGIISSQPTFELFDTFTKDMISVDRIITSHITSGNYILAIASTERLIDEENQKGDPDNTYTDQG